MHIIAQYYLLYIKLMQTTLFAHTLSPYYYTDSHSHRCCRYGVLLDLYLRNCGGEHRSSLGQQMYVLGRLQDVSAKVQATASRGGAAGAKKVVIETARSELSRIIWPERFSLPIRPTFEARGLDVERCRVMFSKKKPLWLEFEAADGWRGDARETAPDLSSGKRASYTVMYKNGDDLRQDQLVLQVCETCFSVTIHSLFAVMRTNTHTHTHIHYNIFIAHSISHYTR